jgi:hypothetical protein
MATAKRKEGRNVMHPSNFANTTDKSGEAQSYNYIPIDYIKCEVIGLDKHHFLNNPNLRFTPKIKDRDELHFYYLIDENIKLKVYESNKISIDGSLHKYANNGIHNFDDFTHVRFFEVLDKLNQRFGITPENMRILCLEYGYNITPPIDPDLIINHLLKHKQKDSEILLSNDRAKYRQFEHQDYIIKTYNKGKQYKCENPILRVEIKQTDWTKYRRIGIHTLDDFIKHDKTTFVNDLLNKWNEVLFYDPTVTDNANFLHYRDVIYWNELRATKSNKTYSVHAKRLREINATKGANVQKLVSDLIREKAHTMRGGNVLLLSQKKYCKLTGIEIHNQRENSFLLSHQGLKYIRKNHPERYKDLERRFLSGKWTNATPQTKIKEIAHNIRTRYTRQTQRHNPNQTTIFEALNFEHKNMVG